MLQYAYIYMPVGSDGRRDACSGQAHCPFAKESILSDMPISPILCYCSLGHVMNFTEAFLGRELEGRVVRSVLNKDLTCEYEITIPEDIMTQYIAPRGMENVIDTRKNE